MSQIQFKTHRLNLRGYRPDDWERVHSYSALPEFSQYELWGPNTADDTKKFVSEMIAQSEQEPRFKFDFAVCINDSGLLIGGCGIRRESQSSCIGNLGWAIDPKHQSQGYATEAARELIRFGFEKLALEVIYATCDSRNVASFKVMEKLGMKRVGHLIGDKMQKGHLRDTYRYELKRN